MKLEYSGTLTTTYPTYNDGWNLIAEPDGTLINLADGRTYTYLFWEGSSNTAYDFSTGFVIAGTDIADFLQTALEQLGLTPAESNDFITYWLPQMQSNPYNLISFQTGCYTEHARLDIQPQPDSILRVFMAWQPLEAPIAINAQPLPAFDRTGFTVVEWGGCKVD